MQTFLTLHCYLPSVSHANTLPCKYTPPSSYHSHQIPTVLCISFTSSSSQTISAYRFDPEHTGAAPRGLCLRLLVRIRSRILVNSLGKKKRGIEKSV